MEEPLIWVLLLDCIITKGVQTSFLICVVSRPEPTSDAWDSQRRIHLQRFTLGLRAPHADEAKLLGLKSMIRVQPEDKPLYTDELVDWIAGRCRAVDSGARNGDDILTRSLIPEISLEVLNRMVSGLPLSRAHASVTDQGEFKLSLEWASPRVRRNPDLHFARG